MLGVTTHPTSQEGNGRAPTLPRPGSGLQTVPGTGPALPLVPTGAPDPAVFADAVARYRALERLRGFRQSLYECLDARADALFELANAVLCADHAVTSLVQLCQEPEFTRGHGALYDALSAGRIDDERFFSLLASELPQAVDGPEARAWIAEHDVIGHGLLGKVLAGLPADDAAQVRDACARWARLRFTAGATAYSPAGPEEPAGPPRHPRPRHRRAPARRPRPAPGHVAVARGPGPLSLDELWRAYLARFDIEHAIRTLKGIPGLTAAKVRAPQQADRWVRLLMAAHAQLLLARPLAARPPPPLGETARSRPAAGPGTSPPGVSQHPLRPGDTRPCRETLPPRTRQAQRQQQRPSSPLPSPRRSRHATHSESGTDQGKG